MSATSEQTVVAMKPAAAEASAHHAVHPAKPAALHNAFIPLLLALLALVASFGAQTAQLISDRQTLQTAHAGQQQTVDNASKLRGSLDGLAADTQRLADGGNANAALLVAELKKRGITINLQAGAAPAEPK